jgi:hypothetical protein
MTQCGQNCKLGTVVSGNAAVGPGQAHTALESSAPPLEEKMPRKLGGQGGHVTGGVL